MALCVLQQVTICVVRGESKTLRLTVKDETGALFDLTGSTIFFSVKLAISDTTFEIVKVSTNPTQILILNQVTNKGQADILLVPADTATIAIGTHVYDVWVQKSDGTRHDVIDPSDFVVFQEVTGIFPPPPPPGPPVAPTIESLDAKQSARVATIANLSLLGLQTVDGVVLVVGDRVLVKNQAVASENGLYVVSSATWSRAADAATSAMVTTGLNVWIEEGTINKRTRWTLLTVGPIVLGATALLFGQTEEVISTGTTIVVPAGANKAAEINASIAALSALWTVDRLQRTIRLTSGIYSTEAPIEGASGVTLKGDGEQTVIRPAFSGGADDPLNAAIRAVGVIDAATLNSTLSAVLNKGASSVTFTSVGTLVAGRWVLIQGRNVTSNSYLDSDNLQVSLSEILQVASVVGTTVTFTTKAHQYHASGVTVRAINPIIDFNIEDVRIDGSATNPAVGALLRSTQHSHVEDISGNNISRTLVDMDQGARDISGGNFRKLGAVNSLAYFDSCMSVELSGFASDPMALSGARFNATGVIRGDLFFRNRPTDCILSDGVLEHTNIGIHIWGGHHLTFKGFHIRDADVTQAIVTLLAQTPDEVGTPNVIGAGVSIICTNIFEFAEIVQDIAFERVDLHDLLVNADGFSWYVGNLYESNITDCAIFNNGLPNSVVFMNGIAVDDSFQLSIKGFRFRGITNCIVTRNNGMSGEVSGTVYESNAGIPAAAAIVFSFLHNSTFSGLRVHTVLTSNSFGFITFPVGYQDYSIRFYDTMLNNECSYWQPARNSTGGTRNVTDVVEIDPATPAGRLDVKAPAGANSRNAVVVVGGVFDAGGDTRVIGIAPLPPPGRAVVQCTSAGVVVGDLLEATAGLQAVTQAVPNRLTALGRAMTPKAPGAPGPVEIGPC